MAEIPRAVMEQLMRGLEWKESGGSDEEGASILEDIIQTIEDTVGFAAPGPLRMKPGKPLGR